MKTTYKASHLNHDTRGIHEMDHGQVSPSGDPIPDHHVRIPDIMIVAEPEAMERTEIDLAAKTVKVHQGANSVKEPSFLLSASLIPHESVVLVPSASVWH